MTQTVREKAQAALAQVEEVNAVILPEPSTELVPLEKAEAPVAAEIRKRMDEVDITDTNSIVSFGSKAQAGLQEISQSMLADVKNKDVGPAGNSLRDIVTTIRGFSVSELNPNRKLSWWEKLIGKAKPAAMFMAKYEDVQGQIDKITADLESHEMTLLKDIKSLDILYARTLDFYEELALYITAGEEKVAELDMNDIPEMEAELEEAPEEKKVMKAQELRDLRAARDDLERRVHDMKLTRQVTMQSLPSIRLVQENDKSLVTKINSTLVNTVPLWETQLAQALTIQRSAEAAEAVRDANDLTNELLKANAENLRMANKSIREEMERGVFDIDAVQKANDDLVATINESLEIADEGKRKRAEAEEKLGKMEAELRDTLASASARGTAQGHAIGESAG
ncbi:MAG: toxic anion resistance protein [Pseudomonadota bacterium]